MESNLNRTNAPMGAPVNNKPATPEAKKEEKKAGMPTGAKVGLGVAAGAAATFGATAAINEFTDGIIVEGAEGVLDDASSMADVLTSEPEVYTPSGHNDGDNTITTAEIDEDVVFVNPNDVILDEPEIEVTNEDFVYEDRMPEDGMPYESPLAYNGDDALIIDDTDDYYSYDDGGDVNCDPTDDIVI